MVQQNINSVKCNDIDGAKQCSYYCVSGNLLNTRTKYNGKLK